MIRFENNKLTGNHRLTKDFHETLWQDFKDILNF